MLSPAGLHKNGTSREGPRQGRSEDQPVERVIAYIDGFNLYFGLKSKGWQKYYWLDPRALAQNLLKPWQRLEMVKYFTARISDAPHDPGKRRRQTTFLEAVETLPQTRIYYGHYLTKPVRCQRCQFEWEKPEEKRTDVNIAVEMLLDAIDGAFDVAILVSGDSDLQAPIQAIRERYPIKKVIVAFPPMRRSDQLASIATASFTLGPKPLQCAQLPVEVVKADGYVLRRPDRWR